PVVYDDNLFVEVDFLNSNNDLLDSGPFVVYGHDHRKRGIFGACAHASSLPGLHATDLIPTEAAGIYLAHPQCGPTAGPGGNSGDNPSHSPVCPSTSASSVNVGFWRTAPR